MKFRWLAIIVLSLLFLLSLPVYAHPGGTDGNGGHTNHSTGEYHYHHGYSEHQHYDIDGDGNIDCPYDFKDNTIDRNNISFSSTNPKETIDYDDYISESISNEHKLHKKAKITARDILEIIFVLVLCYTAGVGLLSVIVRGVIELIEKLAKRDIKVPCAIRKILFIVLHIFYIVTTSVLMLRFKGLL